MIHRSYIRRMITSSLTKLIFDDSEDQYGHSEHLEIIGSIIAGFAVPLKGEHRAIYEKCLVPLHKAMHIQSFHQQLVQCVITYLEKDPFVAGQCIRCMLRYWPVTNPSKEILLLNELEEV